LRGPPRILSLFVAVILATLPATAQSASDPVLRAPVWVYLEPVPGTRPEADTPAGQAPIQQLQSLSRFLLSGMIFGWSFRYTPSDKARNVEESFELTPLGEIAPSDRRFTLTGLSVAYPRLACWCQFSVDGETSRRLASWDSAVYRASGGSGRGERKDEITGIHDAYAQALREAIRALARKSEKNKPREILGEIVLRNEPRLRADEGWFIADVRVGVRLIEVVPYGAY
jgi:hypothetical protein